MQPAPIHPFRAIYFIIFVPFCHVRFISEKFCFSFTNIRIATIIGASNAYHKFLLRETFELKKCKMFDTKDGKLKYFTVKTCTRDKCKW